MSLSRAPYRVCLCWVSILIAVLGCAHRGPVTPSAASRKATPTEIVELKKTYAAYVRRHIESAPEVSVPEPTLDELRETARRDGRIDFRQDAIRRLTFHDDETTQAVLSDLVATGGGVERFLAACVLAYQGRSDGLEILRTTVSEQVVLSSSGFEVSEGGMALAILGYELPPSFTTRVNAFFPMLDRLFE